jgi:hypothetical protein
LPTMRGFRAVAPELTAKRIRAAQIVALIADTVQIALFPIFGAGFSSPFDDVLDAIVSVALIALLGWNWLFLPTCLVELAPLGDLAPTWTAAVFLATRKSRQSQLGGA